MESRIETSEPRGKVAAPRTHERLGSAATEARVAAPEPRLVQFLGPRYWPAWCLVLWMRLVAALPLEVTLRVHRWIGAGLYRIAPKLRRIVTRNLEVCFPELASDSIEALAKRHFVSVAQSFAETAAAWLAPDRRLRGRFTIVGLEHLRKALEHGRGVILYTGHFTTLEICGRPFKEITPLFAAMISSRSNALLNELQRRGRMRLAHELIPSDSVRAMLRSLKRNAAVWYAPDQTDRRGELIPFFGEPAMTNVAVSKLARLSGAIVLPFAFARCDERGRYELRFHAPLADFPSADPVQDTRRLVQYLEQFVRAHPEQYLWLHKRFKDRPAEFPDIYRGGARARTDDESA